MTGVALSHSGRGASVPEATPSPGSALHRTCCVRLQIPGKNVLGVQVRGPTWSGRKSEFAAGLAACGEVGQPRREVPR